MDAPLTRPNTLEAWLPDAALYARGKYRGRMSAAQWDRMEGDYHLMVAMMDPASPPVPTPSTQKRHRGKFVQKFDPVKARAFTFLCMLWNTAYNRHVQREYISRGPHKGERREHRDVMDRPTISWDEMFEDTQKHQLFEECLEESGEAFPPRSTLLRRRIRRLQSLPTHQDVDIVEARAAFAEAQAMGTKALNTLMGELNIADAERDEREPLD